MAKKQQQATRRYRGLTPQQLRGERRQRLLTAGLSLFGERGYAHAPIELICSTAKVATRHFYEQFDGREALLSAVFDDTMQQVGERIDAVLTDESQDLAQRVSDAIQTVMLCLLEDPRRGRVVSLETIGVSAQMERHRRARMHALADVVVQYADHLAASGKLPKRDYHIPAVGLVGMFNELIVEWLVKDTGLTAGEMARESVILFRAMITGAQEYRPQ